MGNYRLNRVLSVFLTLTLSAMTNPVSSQNIPAYDNLTTTAGVVEMHFIGHASLMFKLNNFVIYFDPVRSVGNYDNMPKADLILVTHEHGDHLDTKLIEDLKKDGTVFFGNEGSSAKVPWGKAVKSGDIKNVNNIGMSMVGG